MYYLVELREIPVKFCGLLLQVLHGRDGILTEQRGDRALYMKKIYVIIECISFSLLTMRNHTQRI